MGEILLGDRKRINDIWVHLNAPSFCYTSLFYYILLLNVRFLYILFQCPFAVWPSTLNLFSSRRGGGEATSATSGEEDEVLQAVIIAESFNQRFTPFTKDMPRVRGNHRQSSFMD